MKIDGLENLSQGLFVSHLQDRLCTTVNSANMQLYTYGFDTLRLGLEKIKNSDIQAKNLRQLFYSVGAEFIVLKSYIRDLEYHYWVTDIPKDIADSYTKIYKRPISTISNQFYRYNYVYILRYKGVVLWLLDHQKAKYLTLELYGLSQPHHDKGAIKWEFLNKLLFSLASYQRPTLLSYDFAVDFPKSFKWMIQNIAFPIVIEKINIARGKQKPDIYFYRDDESSGTAYLQPKTKSKRGNKITIYDKQKKHGLEYNLVRIEFTKESKLRLNNINILNKIAKEELLNICLVPERVDIAILVDI